MWYKEVSILKVKLKIVDWGLSQFEEIVGICKCKLNKVARSIKRLGILIWYLMI